LFLTLCSKIQSIGITWCVFIKVKTQTLGPQPPSYWIWISLFNGIPTVWSLHISLIYTSLYYPKLFTYFITTFILLPKLTINSKPLEMFRKSSKLFCFGKIHITKIYDKIQSIPNWKKEIIDHRLSYISIKYIWKDVPNN
jgi:hypothetical protein